MILVLLLLIAGAFAAHLLDEYIIKKRPAIQLEGETLMRVLKNSDSYASIRQHQEVHRGRSSNRSIHHGNSVEQLGDRGDGGEVLRIDSRR